MSEADVQSRARARHFTFSLNSDGQRHPVLNASAGYALVAGVVSMVLGLLSLAAIVGAILGITAFLVGLVAQMMSATRDQRMVIVCGIVASFVGMGLGIAHGGFRW